MLGITRMAARNLLILGLKAIALTQIICERMDHLHRLVQYCARSERASNGFTVRSCIALDLKRKLEIRLSP
jgi:hypothetical protein